MRIAVDARSLLTRHPRGEGRSLFHLYDNVARLRPQWRVVFYGEERADPGFRAANFSNRILSIPGHRFNAWENIALPLSAMATGADLLHSSGSSTPRFPLTPTIMTVHDVIPLIFDDGLSPRTVERFRVQMQAGIRKARGIIVVSENTRTDLLSLFPVDPAKVVVIPWGSLPPPAQVAPELRAVTLAQVEIRAPFVLAFAGGARRKNTEGVLRAFARMRTTEAMLVLVGLNDPASRTSAAKLADELGCGARVRLLNYVDDDTLEIVLQSADVLVYASLYEGFGLPLLEAMSRAVPVVASRTSSIPEVAGDAALLVDPTDPDEIAAAVDLVLNDADRRVQMTSRGLARAAKFTWDDTAQKTVALFESVLARTAFSHAQ